MLKLDDVCVKYGDNRILNGVTFALEQGEFAALIGSNGSGKSTLIKAISGEIKINSGKILLGGDDITTLPGLKRSRFVARVFQNTNTGTVPSLSIRENMILASKRGMERGLKKATIDNNILDQKLSKLGMGLEKMHTRLVSSLSGGQRQALSILMATLIPARLLLLDEHTAALDPDAEAAVMKFTKDIVKDYKLTTLMITHNMDGIKGCDSVYSIKNGKLSKL